MHVYPHLFYSQNLLHVIPNDRIGQHPLVRVWREERHAPVGPGASLVSVGVIIVV